MGAAWNNKLNLYAFRRVLGECGYEKPVSADEISVMRDALADDEVAAGNDEIETALDRYANENNASQEALSKIMSTLRTALLDAQDEIIIRTAESTIRQYAPTLRRKRKQFMLQDDYGFQDRKKWDQEVTYFLETVVLSAIGSDDIPDHLFPGLAGLVEQVAAQDGEHVTDQSAGQTEVLSPQEFETHCAEILPRGRPRRGCEHRGIHRIREGAGERSRRAPATSLAVGAVRPGAVF